MVRRIIVLMLSTPGNEVVRNKTAVLDRSVGTYVGGVGVLFTPVLRRLPVEPHFWGGVACFTQVNHHMTDSAPGQCPRSTPRPILQYCNIN